MLHRSHRQWIVRDLQFPFAYLASDKEEALVAACKVENGFIAMKALSGGLITNSAAAYAHAAHFPMFYQFGVWQRRERSWMIYFLYKRTSCTK